MSFYASVVARNRQQRAHDELDRDPSKWPEGPGSRQYLVDCKQCGNRMSESLMELHMRRHLRRGQVG